MITPSKKESTTKTIANDGDITGLKFRINKNKQ